MARLIDVATDRTGLPPLVVRVGDVLTVSASGGRMHADGPILEQIGPLQSAVVGLDGQVIAPEGPPNVVLFVARAPGRATLDVMTGDPWHRTSMTTYTVVVDA